MIWQRCTSRFFDAPAPTWFARDSGLLERDVRDAINRNVLKVLPSALIGLRSLVTGRPHTASTMVKTTIPVSHVIPDDEGNHHLVTNFGRHFVAEHDF